MVGSYGKTLFSLVGDGQNCLPNWLGHSAFPSAVSESFFGSTISAAFGVISVWIWAILVRVQWDLVGILRLDAETCLKCAFQVPDLVDAICSLQTTLVQACVCVCVHARMRVSLPKTFVVRIRGHRSLLGNCPP